MAELARTLFTYATLAPWAGFIALTMLAIVVQTPRERIVSSVGISMSFASLLLLIAGAVALGMSGESAVATQPFRWVHAGHGSIDLTLRWDFTGLVLAGVATQMVTLVLVFSKRYLHRERGFLRFFATALLFLGSVQIVAASPSLDSILIGWELVGVTSVLLIGFFHERDAPVGAALRAFVTYRLADFALVVAALLLETKTDATLFPVYGALPHDLGTTLIGVAVVLAASGKAAQWPLSGWLPRAMEGPTPSSALFYGAVSVHLGVFLLIRCAPILEASPVARAFALALGLATTAQASLLARAQADAKTTMAFASMAQLGIMVLECAAGFPRVALAHLVGHAFFRGYDLLRAPSALHDAHAMRAAIGHEDLGYRMHDVSSSYYVALRERFFTDHLVERFFLFPLERGAQILTLLEDRWVDFVTHASTPAPAEPRSTGPSEITP